MVITHTKTKTGVASKSTIRGDHRNGWWSERILRREPKKTMVLAIFVWGRWRPRDDEMPF